MRHPVTVFRLLNVRPAPVAALLVLCVAGASLAEARTNLIFTLHSSGGCAEWGTQAKPSYRSSITAFFRGLFRTVTLACQEVSAGSSSLAVTVHLRAFNYSTQEAARNKLYETDEALAAKIKKALDTSGVAGFVPVLDIIESCAGGCTPPSDCWEMFCHRGQCRGDLKDTNAKCFDFYADPGSGFLWGQCDDQGECQAARCEDSYCAGKPPGPCEKGPGECWAGGLFEEKKCRFPADTGAVCGDGKVCTADKYCIEASRCNCTTPPNKCHVLPGICQWSVLGGDCTYTRLPAGTKCGKNKLCNSRGECKAQCATNCTTPPNECYYSKGTCNNKGQCKYTRQYDGTPCKDGLWECQGGVCKEPKPNCSSSKDCKTPPDCYKVQNAKCTKGRCVYRPAPGGTDCYPCSGSASSWSSTCDGHGHCSDLCRGGCKTPGECQTLPGWCYCHDLKCVYDRAPEGSPCNFGGTCNYYGQCRDRACTGKCVSPGECEALPGTCYYPSMLCWYPPAKAGTPCSGGLCDDNKQCLPA